MSLIEFDETVPDSIRVTPRFRPCRMKKVPSVTRKLGRPVRISSQPLKAPIGERHHQRDQHADPDVER